jgi:N6-L-threonylcarbamoyladenine synthase
VLGIETSCDETSAGIVENGKIRGHVVASQDAHVAFGGVVPEIAARAHIRQLDRVVDAALRQAGLEPARLAGVGVTTGPGLMGCLLVGVNWAKALAFGLELPLIGVHHMEAHLFANSLEHPDASPPFVALLVSGGHTLLIWVQGWGRYILLGQTRDDAAGEAFDKVARRLGLPYPGGPHLEREASRGRCGRFALPRPMLSSKGGPEEPAWFDFSFSGLKTAVSLLAEEIEGEGEGELERQRPDLAAEFQEAVVEVLVTKTLRGTELTGCRRVLLGGGVACNSRLQAALADELAPDGELFAPSPRLATDNGAMVARLAEHYLDAGERSGLDLSADPSLPFPATGRT